MGLDSVDILVKVENTFGILISNCEAKRIITVGDYYNVVWSHLNSRQSNKCYSQILFYKLRKSLAHSFNLSADNLKLEISPNSIFPEKYRRKTYLQFAADNNLQLPELTLQPNWNNFLTVFGLATIIGGFLVSLIAINFLSYSKWILLLPIIGIALTWLLSDLLNIKRTIIPSNSLRYFTKEVLSLNYATIVKESGANKKEMESIINHILVNMVGVELYEIAPEKSLTNDLGID